MSKSNESGTPERDDVARPEVVNQSPPANSVDAKNGCATPGLILTGFGILALAIGISFPGSKVPNAIEGIFPDNALTPTCGAGWKTQEVDPIKLAAGFHKIYFEVIKDRNSINSRSYTDAPQPEAGSPQAVREQAVYEAADDLQGYSETWGASYERLDRPSQVGCEAEDGSYQARAAAMDAFRDLRAAGYTIDPMTGAIRLPAIG